MKKFLIDSLSGFTRTALTENGELIELIIESKTDEPRTGDIFAARVDKVIKNQYAFVDIGAEKKGFLQLNGNNIQQGQALLVQVQKQAYEEKGCALSTELAVNGRLAVVTNDGKPIGISHKITDTDRRQHLSRLVVDVLPQNFSCVIRTNAETADDAEILQEIKALSDRLSDIIEKGRYAKPPYRIYQQQQTTLQLLQDCYAEGDEIVTNSNEYYAEISNSFANVALYDKDIPLFMEYGIESRIDKLLHRKIWLDCGGFIVFDYTEAMTVIDVNTGKFTDSKNMRKAVLKTNLQAAREIAKQLRLRNLSGIIIIDFVNMQHKEDIETLEQELRSAISKDRLKTIYVGMTQLGLAQLTRHKQNKPLHLILSAKCKGCNGDGFTVSHQYLCGKIKNEVINAFSQTIYKEVTISSNAALIKALKNTALDKIEEKYNKKINLLIIETAAHDYYEIGFSH